MDYYTTAAAPTPTLTGGQVGLLIAFSGLYLLFVLAIAAIGIVATWRIFTKAGQAGWKSLIPLYNVYIFLKIVGRPGWWLLLLIIPLVNIVISLVLAIDLGKSFNKPTAYSVVLLWLLSFIGYCLLAFSKDVYVGPDGARQVSADIQQAPSAIA